MFIVSLCNRNGLAGRSKRLTAECPANISFRDPKVALFHVPETNDFGTKAVCLAEN
jgi:hypothetical protein